MEKPDKGSDLLPDAYEVVKEAKIRIAQKVVAEAVVDRDICADRLADSQKRLDKLLAMSIDEIVDPRQLGREVERIHEASSNRGGPRVGTMVVDKPLGIS